MRLKILPLIIALAGFLSATAAAVVHRSPAETRVVKTPQHQMPSAPGDDGKRYF